MRILKVTESYVPFDEFGGPPVKVRALSEGMGARGHEVTVLTADWGVEKRLAELRAAPAERCPFGWRRNTRGATAIYLPTWFHYRATSWNPAVKRFCRARLRNFDIAHIFGLYDLLGPAVASFCRERGVPYVVEPIGMFLPIVRSLRMKRIYHALFGKPLLAGAAAVVATSEQERSALISGGISEGRIVLRRNGVSVPERFPERGGFRSKHGIPAGAPVVLFLGRLSRKKSPELLLRAFAGLDASRQDAAPWLVFAGPDSEGMRSQLEQMTREFGLEARVRFAGPLFGDEKWAAYGDADAFALPSLNENFGNTALEAAATGTPVVLTENCGIAPLLRDGAALVVPHNEEALRKALEKVMGDSETSRRLACAGRFAAARLGWEEPLAQMEDVYRRLAAAASGVGQSGHQG